MLTVVRIERRRRGLPGQYEGVHVFAFLYEEDEILPATVMGNLQPQINREVGPVYFASFFEGDFQGFAHIAQDDARGRSGPSSTVRCGTPAFTPSTSRRDSST
jgi:hypothetical protein